MKRFSRLVCMLLIAAMVFAIPANAAEQASNFFMSHSCYLWNVSSTGFDVWFDVDAVEGMDVLGVSEIKIQRSTDKANWTTIQTYPGIYQYNTGTAGGHVTFTGRQPGYYYRALVTFYAENWQGVGEYLAATSYV